MASLPFLHSQSYFLCPLICHPKKQEPRLLLAPFGHSYPSFVIGFRLHYTPFRTKLQDKRGIFKKSILQKNPLVKENLNQGEIVVMLLRHAARITS